MFRKRRRGEDDGGIDLTPMLDVTFNMLIFFIVTSSFVKALASAPMLCCNSRSK